MNKRVLGMLILPALLSALAACGPTATTGTPTGSPAATDEESLAAATAPTAGSTPAPGLAALTSYALHFSIVSETTVEGQTSSSVYRLEVQRRREPFIQRVVIHPVDGQDPVELIQTREHYYLVPADGPCQYTVAGDSDPVAPEFFRPEELVGGESDAERVGPDETVNGVLAHRYVIGDSSPPDALSRTEGEVWVATEGDYVVRYILRTDTQDPDTGEAGHIELEYEITDVGVPFDIEEPANCLPTDRQLPGVPSPTG